MSKKERQAYREGIKATLYTIALMSTAIFCIAEGLYQYCMR